MLVGKGSGRTTKGFAPHREKGMLTVRQSSRQVRILPTPAEPQFSFCTKTDAIGQLPIFTRGLRIRTSFPLLHLHPLTAQNRQVTAARTR
jgi:hypothetical protein